MPIIYKNGNIYGAGGGGGTAATTTFDDTNVEFEADDVQEAFEEITKTVTQAEYDALSIAEKNNGTIYLISDGTATNVVECTQATYPTTPEQDTFYLISDAPSLQGTSADLLYESGSTITTKAKIDSKADQSTTYTKTEVDTALSSKANKNVIETFTLTFASITGLVIHGQSCYYVPITGQVFINIDIYSNNNNIPNNGEVIATIPSNYRPSAVRTVATFANIYDGSSVAKLEAIQPIGTDGEIKLHNYIYGGAINTLNMNFSYYI